jgi:hypothetical protein
MHRKWGLWVLLAALGGGAAAPRAASAQEEAEEDIMFDFEVEGGLEILEEPLAALAELENNPYLALNAAGLVRLYNFQTVIQAPLRFDLTDFGIRPEDWDEGRDYLRILRCARIDYMSRDGAESWQREYGGCTSWTPDEAAGDVATTRENLIYLSARMRPVYELTLGYGSLVQGYNATLEENEYRDGISLEANINRHFTVNAALSDVVDPDVVAGRVAFRPIQSAAGDNVGMSNESFVEVGVTAATDLNAPTRLSSGAFGEEGLVAGGVDARFRFSDENRYEGQYRVLRFELGGEFNQLFDYGSGAHGHLRFYYDVGPFDFYIDGEYRAILGQYLPAFFNQHYRVQRSQYFLSEDQRERIGAGAEELFLTKLDFLGRLPEETEHAYAATMRFRFWREVQGGWNPSADIHIFAEQTPGRDDSGRAGVGLTLYQLADKVDVDALFVQQGWDDVSGIFRLDGSVLDVSARYPLSEELYLVLFFDQTWYALENGSLETANNFGATVGYAH